MGSERFSLVPEARGGACASRAPKGLGGRRLSCSSVISWAQAPGIRPPDAAWTLVHRCFNPASDRPCPPAPVPLPPLLLRLSERLREEQGIDGEVEAGSTEERSIAALAESGTSASVRRPQIITLSGEGKKANAHASPFLQKKL